MSTQALLEQNEALMQSCRELEAQLASSASEAADKSALSVQVRELEQQVEAHVASSDSEAAEKSALSVQVRELEQQVENMKQTMATSDEDRIMTLMLELEKERGKLAGAPNK